MSAILFVAMAAATPAANSPVPVMAAPVIAAPDPARLAIARSIAGRMLPDGTFEKVMSAMMGGLMQRMTDSMMNMPMKSMVGMAGMSEEKLKGMGPATMRQAMAILDPAFDQRLKIMFDVMGPEMGKLMTTMEPDMRDALALSYAARFSETELKDVDGFFTTPAGSKFASQFMTIQTDPVFLDRMQALVPTMMQGMPAIMKKIEAASASLPKPKKPQDLTAAEKAELAKILGTDPDEVK